MNVKIRSENAPLKVGDEFLKYEIRALLGHGDHAYVYEAFDPMLERTVAIKVIPDPPNSRRDLAQRSLEQGPILRDLNHRNLVSVYDVGTIGDDLVYIVMERLVGHSLREMLLHRHTLPVSEVLSIGIQVAEGVAWAHALQVIHRDLKPENVFITDDQRVIVINTGITSFIVPSGKTTEWDCVSGTLLYMSPEHLQGFGVTARSDIFSLGALMYECLVGSPPALIGAEPSSLDELAWRQISHMPPPASEVSGEIPDIVARLIQQMLAKEAVLRFSTMDEVASSLRELYGRLIPDAAAAKRDEPKPYIVFPSTALGMKASVPRRPPRAEAVIAGAKRLINALTLAKTPDRSSSTHSVERGDERSRFGAANGWWVLAMALGLVAAAVALLMRSVTSSHLPAPRPSAMAENLPAAAGSTAAVPAQEPVRDTGHPSDVKNQKKSVNYEPVGSSANASGAPRPAPVINRTTRSATPRANASSAVPNKLVF